MKGLSDQQLMRYSRHIMLPAVDIDGQEKLWNSRVLIIGLGGLGCAAAQYLTASGIGKLTLVDDDLVDMSNLQRQVLHLESRVGVNKAVSAQQSLFCLNSEVAVTAIEQRLNETELRQQIADHDVVVDCCDNLPTRNLLNKLCWQLTTPLISGAAIRMEGQIATFSMDEKSACYQCLSQLFGEQQLTCSESGILSPVVGVIGNLQAIETIKLITKVGDTLANQLLIFDAYTLTFNRFNLNKSEQCTVCSK